MDVNGARSLPWQVTVATSVSNVYCTAATRCLWKDIAQLLNETSGLQESNLVAEVLVNYFCNSDECK